MNLREKLANDVTDMAKHKMGQMQDFGNSYGGSNNLNGGAAVGAGAGAALGGALMNRVPTAHGARGRLAQTILGLGLGGLAGAGLGSSLIPSKN